MDSMKSCCEEAVGDPDFDFEELMWKTSAFSTT
jgi:hypothetical protein